MSKTFRKARITATLIEGLAAGETVMDTEEPGFGVRRQGARPIYFVRKHRNGQRHFETIGEHGTAGLTVKSARDKAERIIAAIKDGASPAERRARERAMPTVAELAEHWLAAHVDAKRKPKTARDYRIAIKHQVGPHLGRVRVDQLEPSLVAHMHVSFRGLPMPPTARSPCYPG